MDYLTGKSPSFEDTIVTDIAIEQDLTDNQKRILRKVVKDIIPSVKEFDAGYDKYVMDEIMKLPNIQRHHELYKAVPTETSFMKYLQKGV